MKQRLDAAMLERGLAKSRQRAKDMILGGGVFVNAVECGKPAREVSDEDVIEFRGEELLYVGKGGLKLEAALNHFKPEVSDALCLDIGASTGGFTDCLLRNGAKQVYALDVGTLQLDKTLREDSRVVSMEKTDIRTVSSDAFEALFDIITIDVSFISLRLVLPYALPLLRDGGTLIALIKPQFEAGRQALSKRGVVLSQKARENAAEDIESFCTLCGLDVNGRITSPVVGGSGNIEYLICCTKGTYLHESSNIPEF